MVQLSWLSCPDISISKSILLSFYLSCCVDHPRAYLDCTNPESPLAISIRLDDPIRQGSSGSIACSGGPPRQLRQLRQDRQALSHTDHLLTGVCCNHFVVWSGRVHPRPRAQLASVAVTTITHCYLARYSTSSCSSVSHNRRSIKLTSQFSVVSSHQDEYGIYIVHHCRMQVSCFLLYCHQNN